MQPFLVHFFATFLARDARQFLFCLELLMILNSVSVDHTCVWGVFQMSRTSASDIHATGNGGGGGGADGDGEEGERNGGGTDLGSGIVSNHPNAKQWNRFDHQALHIQHALRATEVQRKYSKPHEKPLEEFLVSF